MNREIKFRAWHPSAGIDESRMKMTYWELGSGLDKSVFFKSAKRIMQYTGFNDNNGKEIYEGDIILIEDEYTERILDDGSGPTEPLNHLAPIIFKDGSFGVDITVAGNWFKKGFYSFYQIKYNSGQTEFEIVGNIYENPVLGTSKKDG